MQRIVIVPLIAVPFLLAGLEWRVSLDRNGAKKVTFSGVVESREIRIGSRVGGRIQEVLVNEGEFVHPGQLLVRLDAYDLAAGRDEAAARAREALATLAKLQEGSRPEEAA